MMYERLVLMRDFLSDNGKHLCSSVIGGELIKLDLYWMKYLAQIIFVTKLIPANIKESTTAVRFNYGTTAGP